MRNELWEPLVTIAGGVIAVAIIAVLVSRNAQTPQVFGAAGSAFSNVLSAATGPVTGAVAAPVNTFSSNSLSLPALSLGGGLGGTLLA